MQQHIWNKTWQQGHAHVNRGIHGTMRSRLLWRRACTDLNYLIAEMTGVVAVPTVSLDRNCVAEKHDHLWTRVAQKTLVTCKTSLRWAARRGQQEPRSPRKSSCRISPTPCSRDPGCIADAVQRRITPSPTPCFTCRGCITYAVHPIAGRPCGGELIVTRKTWPRCCCRLRCWAATHAGLSVVHRCVEYSGHELQTRTRWRLDCQCRTIGST